MEPEIDSNAQILQVEVELERQYVGFIIRSEQNDKKFQSSNSVSPNKLQIQ